MQIFVIGVNSTFNRMNQGQTYEVSLKAAMLELKQWVCNTVNLNESTPNLRDKVIRLPRDVLEPIFARLERFYEICSNKHYDFYKSMSFQEKDSRFVPHDSRDTNYLDASW